MPQQDATISPAVFSAALLADGPVGFCVTNAKANGGPVVFISTDPQYGKLSLVIQNNTSDPIVLEASSLLTLYLAPLLVNDEINRITVATSDWARKPVADEDKQLHLELRPTKRLTLSSGTPLEIPLDNVLASGKGKATSGRFRAVYCGFGALKPGAQRITAMRHLPPDQTQDWPLMPPEFGERLEYSDGKNQGRTIYVTPWATTPTKGKILNTFVLNITATSAVPFTSDDKPCITISFLSGDTDASLCSDEELAKIDVDIAQNPEDSAQNPQDSAQNPEDSAQNPEEPWAPTKDSIGDLPIFGAIPQPGTKTFPAASVLAIRFGNLATTLPSNKSSPVLIQFTGMRHYNDGYAIVELEKADPVPFLRLITAYAGTNEIPQTGTTDYGPVTLKWDVFAAENCLVADAANVLPAKVLDPVGTSTIMPYATSMHFIVQPQVGTRASPSVSFYFSVTPPGAEISASPEAVAPNTTTALSLTCSNAGHCNVVSSSDGSVIFDGPPPDGPIAATVGAADTTFTLTSIGAGSQKASKTVLVPPVDADIEVNVTVSQNRRAPLGNLSWWTVTVTWHTYCANSCTVVRVDNGEVISHDLQGTWTLSGRGRGSRPAACPRQFRITANGRGSVQKDGVFSW